MPGRWSVNIGKASSATLLELYQLLATSEENPQQVLEIQRELVGRARAKGLTTQAIVKTLVTGVRTRRAREEVALAWAEALGLTESEAKRMAR